MLTPEAVSFGGHTGQGEGATGRDTWDMGAGPGQEPRERREQGRGRPPWRDLYRRTPDPSRAPAGALPTRPRPIQSEPGIALATG